MKKPRKCGVFSFCQATERRWFGFSALFAEDPNHFAAGDAGRPRASAPYGAGTMRMYGLGDSQPSG